MRHGELADRIGELAEKISRELSADHCVIVINYNPDSRKLRKTGPFRRGFPDLVICGLGGVLFAELKCLDDTLSPDQRLWQRMLSDAGQRHVVWEPMDLLTGRIETELAKLADRYGFLE